MNLLALILFLPWFAILGSVFWWLPRERPRGTWRNRFDVIALVLALAASVLGMHAGLVTDAGDHHPIWRQVLACLYAYGAFVGVLVLAAVTRTRRR
ncbi:MAG: hypothetical protein HYV17_02750 [Xanthomonadales bacterium]|nr:hypothetical protein [Xanthomonadales bacterium]